ncbi:SDR family oxidoreductase [Streptomyces sp. SID3343]|uniref:SDR family oxidoreductase n=1 Tax=Streptomyces sp. SID3343 TaxID=2690260 RepID=UPI00136E628D|nr:SDR family oxidoreductase [Streptomyces sp. SID3343]MYV98968.1 SDR family oxidoreductase [Streptomyces sp. SID3343]
MGDFLTGKVIAVTGAGRGIGRAVALAAAAHGAKVVVNDYGVAMDGSEPTSEVADAVVKEIEALGGEAVAVADSVASMEGGARIVNAGVEKWGRIDGVVTVAGNLRERMLFNMTEDEWDSVIATHLKGTFTVVQAASKVMKTQGFGSIVGFTSGVYAVGSVAQANYAAAKGGIVSFVRSAALGLNKYGVNANCVAPVARTRMSEGVPQTLKEIGEPEDVAELVVFLLSDHAKDITGQVYTTAGPKIALWDQPHEIKTMYTSDRWTAEEIAEKLPTQIGQDPMPVLAQLKEYAAAAAKKKAAEAAAAAGN